MESFRFQIYLTHNLWNLSYFKLIWIPQTNILLHSKRKNFISYGENSFVINNLISKQGKNSYQVKTSLNSNEIASSSSSLPASISLSFFVKFLVFIRPPLFNESELLQSLKLRRELSNTNLRVSLMSRLKLDTPILSFLRIFNLQNQWLAFDSNRLANLLRVRKWNCWLALADNQFLGIYTPCHFKSSF